MRWNNSQAGYINNFVSNFPLKKFVPIFFSSLFFSSHFFFFLSFFFLSFFSLSSFSPSFQDKLDKMQIGSGEDVNDLNYDYGNEQCVARGGN